MLTACAVSGALALASCGKTVATDGNVDIIPLPEKVVVGEDVFVLKPTTSVVLFFNPENIDYAVDFWRDVMTVAKAEHTMNTARMTNIISCAFILKFGL